MHSYRYPHPAVTVDCVVFGLDRGDLKILLVERGQDPYLGSWALPGGFIKMDEDLEAAARRELEEETGVRRIYIEQIGAFGAPDRDPRERVVTVAYWAIVNLYEHAVAADTDARDAAWFPVDAPPPLAFDHRKILAAALAKLRARVVNEPIGFEFLPREFSLTQLQRLYETILRVDLDKRNFRKKILATGVLKATEHYEVDVAHRAARLYRFDTAAYARLKKSGFHFEL